MSELNREEIIKALEWCIQSEGCEYCEYNKGNIDVCSIRSDALTLIKLLIVENDRLKEKADRHLDNLKAVLEERAEQDVAREIFEEIKYILNHIGYLDHIDFEKLKKKYIG